MNRFVQLLTFLAACLAAIPAFAQRELKDIPDPDPEIERQSFQVAEGFEVNLYAADPRIAKPIQMNFDARGRLWIASSSIYPHIEPGQEANDRILVVEDVDGDGVAEKTSVFAEGLLIPTGIEPGDGGAYVANSTELVHFHDADGDGKADSKRVLLSGFGTEDTHHIIHTFRWGMDGALYFNQSIYIHSHIETPWGVRRLGGGGIWQFRPESLQLEILCRGFVNTWGHHFDDWGQSFATDGAYGDGVNYVFPGSVWVTAPGATRTLRGLNPGSPKHCGLEVLSGSHLPDDWRGNIVTNDFRGHRVCRFVISEDGSGFASREQPELIKTTHVAFRPIDVKMGPDGAIYIADWYNPIIQHGEVDFRDPRRDHTHGRIWRVTAKGRPLVRRPQLADAEVPKLLDALKSPESFTRHHAKRVLKERGAQALLPMLKRWIESLDPADPQVEHHRLEGLWTYQSLDVIAPGLLVELLRATDHRARAAAVRVLAQWRDRVPEALGLLSASVEDDHPRVRLEAVRALALIPGLPAAESAMLALDRPMDTNLDFALWQTARDLEGDWLSAVQNGTADFGGNVDRQIFALSAIGTSAAVPPLVRLLKAGRVPAQSEDSVQSLITGQGDPADLRLIYDMAMADGQSAEEPALAIRLLTKLNQAAQRRKVIPEGDLSSLESLFGKSDALDEVAARAAGHWKLEKLRSRLVTLATAGDEATGSDEPAGGDELAGGSRGAIDAMALLGGDASRETLTALARGSHSVARRSLAIAALASLDLAAAARVAVDALAGFQPGDDPTPIFNTFWREKQGPRALVDALGERPLPPDVAKLGVRAARSAGRDLTDAIAALNKSAGLTGSPMPPTPEQMRHLIADVKEQGNAARGEGIFRRTDQVCLKCHAVSGAGGQVGPDLASIGASAQVDYLIDSLLLPNKQVKENYHSVAVETKAGKVITGIKVRQTDRELVLRDAEDQEVVVSLDDIDQQSAGGSIMPAGLIESLTRGELVDLVRFLSELGKVGPYAPSQARLARRWQALDPASPGLRDLLLSNPESVVSQTSFVWNPVYTRVSGELPFSELPIVRGPNGNGRWSYVRSAIEVTTGGKVGLQIHSSAGLAVWIDGKPIDAKADLVVELAAGRHRITLRVDRAAQSDGLRMELVDVAGSAAQAQLVGGK